MLKRHSLIFVTWLFKMRFHKYFSSFSQCLLAIFVLLFVPFRWILGWILAVECHELGHYIALRLFQIPVYNIRFGISGAVMETAPMGSAEEVICTAAGPFAGFLLVLLWDFLPIPSKCAMIHSLYNLLPIYPLDGGRILYCILRKRLSSDKSILILKTIRCIVLLFLAVIAVILCAFAGSGPVPMLGVLVLWWKTSENT